MCQLCHGDGPPTSLLVPSQGSFMGWMTLEEQPAPWSTCCLGAVVLCILLVCIAVVYLVIWDPDALAACLGNGAAVMPLGVFVLGLPW